VPRGLARLRVAQVLRRLDTALERAGDDRGQRQLRDALGQRGGLLLTALVEVHAGRAAGQHRAGHRGEPVPDEQQRGHRYFVASMVPTESSTMSSTPSPMR
jgi:hypothetical protein